MRLEQNTRAEDEDRISVIILCIDTEVRDRIVYWLKPLPIRAFVAKDGYQAHSILRDVPCRLLITDRLLPPWPGLGRIHKLLAHDPAYASHLSTTAVQTDDGLPMQSVQPISCLGHSFANRLSIFSLDSRRTEIARDLLDGVCDTAPLKRRLNCFAPNEWQYFG